MTESSVEAEARAIIARIQSPKIETHREIDLIEFSGITSFEGDRLPRRFQRSTHRQQGGGTFDFHPEGQNNFFKLPVTYGFSGPAELKSGVRILLDRSIILDFAFDPSAYSKDGEGHSPDTKAPSSTARLHASARSMRPIFKRRELWHRHHAPHHRKRSQGQKWMWENEFADPNQPSASRSYERLKHEFNQANLPLSERRASDPSEWFLRPTLFEFIFAKGFI